MNYHTLNESQNVLKKYIKIKMQLHRHFNPSIVLPCVCPTFHVSMHHTFMTAWQSMDRVYLLYSKSTYYTLQMFTYKRQMN